MGKDRLDQPLDINNYATWKTRFELLCGELGYGNALLAAPISDADVTMSTKVKSILAKNVRDHHLQTIVRAPNAKAAWDALAATFASSCVSRKLQLREELCDFKMATGEKIPVYVNRARQLQSDLLQVGHVVPDNELALVLLKGLPSIFRPAKVAIMMREGELELSHVIARLTTYETSEADFGQPESSAYSVRQGVNNGSTSGRTSGRSSGRWTGSKDNATCHYCGKPGHFLKECKKRLADQQQGRGKGSNQRNEPKMAYAINGEARLDAWYLDSGSEWHITYDASELEEVRAVKPEESFKVIGYDGSEHQPTHVGCYNMKSNTVKGLEFTLNNVYVVPNAKVKLISAGIFDERGATIVLGDGKALVRHNGRTILRGDKVGRIYAVRYDVSRRPASEGRSCAAIRSEDSKAALWHRRLGHLGYSSLERMCRENMVTGMELDRVSLEAARLRICEPCVYAKQTRGPFPPTGHKAAKPLGLIHLDVCGPMPETSLGGARYVTTLLDDCTGFSTVAFTETKDAVEKKVKIMIETLENQSGHRVKEVRTDRGTEFLNSSMSAYFGDKGIIHSTTVGYTPEQNGAAERLNRTLLEKTRAMLAESGLPQKLWGEAMATANRLRNISPIVGAKVTPYEAFTGTKPDVGYLRTFGCAAYAHVPKEKRNKLQPVSRKGVLVGYESGKQYRILFGNVIGVHSAVKFDETAVGGSSEVSDDESEEDPEEAGEALPPGGGGGTPVSPSTDTRAPDVNRGASTSTGQITAPRSNRSIPPAQFPRTRIAEQPRGGNEEASAGNREQQVQQQDGDGDATMQDRRYPLRERKRLIEWQHEPNGRVTYGRINTVTTGREIQPLRGPQRATCLRLEEQQSAGAANYSGP
ncbi:hypothetical protein Vafri_12688 [Volvox africanus]|uniref:Retrovirus-related Pol polyprotein from transposon TNT 1-94 n=1 Tax=Volvox africanus TaxID=51714 RepID=A0A8J4BAQ0_9CHLO|nr:hypothetical protein Vafri_12688 [Volvox africanus]